MPLCVVLPVYHEQETLPTTLAELAAKVTRPHRVLVVYDRPDDPTVPVARALQATYPNLELIENQLGPGVLNAIRTGFQHACPSDVESGADAAVVVVMADLSDDLAQVEPMYRRLVDEGYDVVAGSRYSPGGAQHGGGLLKTSLSRLAGRSLAALTTIPTRDVTNAFKMYRASFLRQVEIESQGGFELSMELTIKAWAYGFRVSEVPSVWRDRAAGESKFKLAAWLPKYLGWYVAALGHHYLGRPIGSGVRADRRAGGSPRDSD